VLPSITQRVFYMRWLPKKDWIFGLSLLLAFAAGGVAHAQSTPVVQPLPVVQASPTDAGAPAQPVQTAPAPQPAPPVRVAESSYRINPGDELSISVWGEERLQREIKVLPDGTFAYPLIGQIVAQGRLPQDIEAIILDRLKDQYRGQVPQITVMVKLAAGLQFSVMGRVKSPGTLSPGRYINVLEALSIAGGPTEFANLDNILVLRKRGDGLQTIRVKLGGVFRGGARPAEVDRSNIVRLEAGDTVIVP
jgi:polysaccharide biosynthesis/export protein